VTRLDTTTAWLLVVGLSVGTYLLRASFLLGVDRLGGLPDPVERVLPFVPTAVLAALVAPNLVVVEGALALSPANPRLLAGIVGFAVAWRTRSMLWTVTAGMAALWLFQWI
jgi:branched-subunit amino acid transport protein